MEKRAHRLWGVLGFLVTVAVPVCLRAQEPDPRQVWTGSGGDARLELRADGLTGFGLEVAVDGRPARGSVETQRRLTPEDRLVIEAPHGNFARFLSGRVVLDTGWTLRYRGREVPLDGLVLTPGIYRNNHPSLEARDKAGRHLLTFSHLHVLAQHERGTLIVHNADVEVTAELAGLLGLPALADYPFAMAWLDLYLDVPAGADTSGRGGGACDDRPFWPQEGHPVDVGLIGIGQVSHQSQPTPDGRIKVTPSATLKNLGGLDDGDVPWIAKFTSLGSYPYDPADQHPFLVWNMYRVTAERIEQLGASGVKHAFLTLNDNCTLDCGGGDVLWPGCEDVYGVGTNESGGSLGPRPEIEASVGLFFSTCSFFDPDCNGTQNNSSGTFENRLLVDPADLQTAGADYYLDSWYVIQYDIDIWNSMAYHEIHPTAPVPPSTMWTFGPLGPFTNGRVLDQWVDPKEPGPDAGHAAVVVPSATPEAPYPGNMPQGHINVVVKVSEPEPGLYRYNYAVQNFDFERGVEAFRVPVGAGAEVFETFFRDIDENSENDWTVSTDGGFVEFLAPSGSPLPWFTLFNFEIETDAPPAASQVTLALGGDAVVPTIDAAILGPGTVSVPVEASPMALAVDPESGTSNGNGVFEPAELVTVAPAWRNDGAGATELTGGAAQFGGPAGANYSLLNASAGYGLVAPGATASCLDTGDCYQMGLNAPAPRPAAHWDATFEETLAGGPTRTWTLHIGASFGDVPSTSPFYPSIETLLHHGVTGGCATDTYCPAAPNTRAQMPVFLLKALEGGGYTPPACTGVFDDVPCPSLFAAWIEDLVARGVTAGCGSGNYCPSTSVTRDQMAVFLLKTLEGPSYVPPSCTGVFDDVSCPSLFAAWVEDLVSRGITAGCGGGNYCPTNPVSRDQMAVFLSKTFTLTLYGP